MMSVIKNIMLRTVSYLELEYSQGVAQAEPVDASEGWGYFP